MPENDKKATIIVKKKSGDQKLTCHFNPTDYSITRSNSWEAKTAVGKDVPNFNFKGGGGNEMTLKLLFDTSITSPVKDVRKETSVLWDALYIDPDNKDPKTKKSQPPHIVFIWGRTWTFEAIITNITQDFILFNEDGVPLRSNVTLKLKQIKDDRNFGRQNPTSGGVSGNIYVVHEGDRLDLLANQYYQKPMLWRYIAEHNDIDNPHQLQPGQRLVIPDLP